jgi:ATP synthase F1 gamma subunit
MASRRNAMDTANKNAEEMIRALTIQFNKLRQATITTELTEIVSGANVVQELTS